MNGEHNSTVQVSLPGSHAEARPGMEVHTCNLGSYEAEGPRAQDQPGLENKILPNIYVVYIKSAICIYGICKISNMHMIYI